MKIEKIVYNLSSDPHPDLPPGGKELSQLSPLGETGKGVISFKRFSPVCRYAAESYSQVNHFLSSCNNRFINHL